MKLRDPNTPPPDGGFCFFHHTRDDAVIKLMGANGIGQLTELATASLKNNGMAVPDNLREIIEHQICVRQQSPTTVCWSGGIGDDLHNKYIGPFLKKVSDGAVKAGFQKLGKVIAAVGKCASCGGSRVYKDGKNNLGRAGTLNKLGKRI